MLDYINSSVLNLPREASLSLIIFKNGSIKQSGMPHNQ